ncbi:hypothetical protein [Phenylobacterium sp.]|jgi:hypothetical protein|uniref:hypothetical protein n=1 Tax=Phenylobacterium sp. TaxID=1871053 RepID=UPI00378479D7
MLPTSGATTAQVKADINSGATGDKVGGFDPAMSPLGTDEEAGGVSPDPGLIAQARAAEQSGRPANATPNAATPELQPNAQLKTGAPVTLPLLLGIGIAVLLAVAWYLMLGT